MQKWNRKINLTGSSDDLFIIQQHFIDSLSCVIAAVIQPQSRLLDIGTGAGFPGIPLKIYYPDLRLTAVDAVSKKLLFLRHLCRSLALQHVECIATRLVPSSPFPENVSKKIRHVPELPEQHFDIIVSRAVGEIPYLLELAIPFLAPNGYLLLQRGKNGKKEFGECQQFLQANRIQLLDIVEVSLSFLRHPRYLLILCQSQKALF